MEKQNVTLSLPSALLKKAKVAAASQETSLSEMLKEALMERVGEETGYTQAKRRQLAQMSTGFDLGSNGRLTVPREDLHGR